MIPIDEVHRKPMPRELQREEAHCWQRRAILANRQGTTIDAWDPQGSFRKRGESPDQASEKGKERPAFVEANFLKKKKPP